MEIEFDPTCQKIVYYDVEFAFPNGHEKHCATHESYRCDCGARHDLVKWLRRQHQELTDDAADFIEKPDKPR